MYALAAPVDPDELRDIRVSNTFPSINHTISKRVFLLSTMIGLMDLGHESGSVTIPTLTEQCSLGLGAVS